VAPIHARGGGVPSCRVRGISNREKKRALSLVNRGRNVFQLVCIHCKKGGGAGGLMAKEGGGKEEKSEPWVNWAKEERKVARWMSTGKKNLVTTNPLS